MTFRIIGLLMVFVGLAACDNATRRRHDLAMSTAEDCRKAQENVRQIESMWSAIGKRDKNIEGRHLRDETCKLAKQAAALDH